MFIIISKYLLPKSILGLTIFPFIILKNKKDRYNKILLNHEKIHIKQQIELFVLPFYLLYLLDFIIQYLKYKNIYRAYRNIIFEKEAYANESNLNYLSTRKLFGFMKFY